MWRSLSYRNQSIDLLCKSDGMLLIRINLIQLNPFHAQCCISYRNQSFKWLVYIWNATLGWNGLTHFTLVLHFYTTGLLTFSGGIEMAWHGLTLHLKSKQPKRLKQKRTPHSLTMWRRKFEFQENLKCKKISLITLVSINISFWKVPPGKHF